MVPKVLEPLKFYCIFFSQNSDADIEGHVHQLSISASENIYTDLGDTIERLVKYTKREKQK